MDSGMPHKRFAGMSHVEVKRDVSGHAGIEDHLPLSFSMPTIILIPSLW